jgi:hypothetical protein
VWATDVDPSKKTTIGGLIAPLNAQADALWDAQPLDGMPTAVVHVLDNRHLRLAPSSTGWCAPKKNREGGGKMRQLQVKKTVKRGQSLSDPLPLDPRDADVVRAKQRLYEREAHAAPPDR